MVNTLHENFKNAYNEMSPDEQRELRVFSIMTDNLLNSAAYSAKIANVLCDNLVKADLQKMGDAGVIPSCQKGCSFCCYLHVNISGAEAKILKPYVKPEMIPVLQKQSKCSNVKEWSRMPYQDRKCVFLKDNECSVYADRPIGCRKYYVVNPPQFCNTETQIYRTQYFSMIKASLVQAALMEKTGQGTMAKMILNSK